MSAICHYDEILILHLADNKFCVAVTYVENEKAGVVTCQLYVHPNINVHSGAAYYPTYAAATKIMDEFKLAYPRKE